MDLLLKWEVWRGRRNSSLDKPTEGRDKKKRGGKLLEKGNGPARSEMGLSGKTSKREWGN